MDAGATARAGVEVVRRRSGGGAVLLTPGDVWWVDVDLPVGDPLWDDDVGRSFLWLGDAWAGTIEALTGVPAVVHRAGLWPGDWSPLVCFAGLGPGEVTMGGRKVVGMAQRRTRAGARFQCALLRRWDPAAVLDLLALPLADRRRAAEELSTVATGIHPLRLPVGQHEDASAVVEQALLARLPG